MKQKKTCTAKTGSLLGEMSTPLQHKTDTVKRTYRVLAAAFAMTVLLTTPAFAAGGDPLAVINNLSSFIFSLIRAVGMILLGWGIVQVGLSFQSHDPSQRSQGFLTLAGGLVVTFTKEILELITGTAV